MKKKPTVVKEASENVKKSPPSKKILNIYVNTYSDTEVKIHEWKIKSSKAEPDFQRVEVQGEDLCYSVILDPLEPKLQTWEVDAAGQIGKSPIATIGLPFLKGTANI